MLIVDNANVLIFCHAVLKKLAHPFLHYTVPIQPFASPDYCIRIVSTSFSHNLYMNCSYQIFRTIDSLCSCICHSLLWCSVTVKVLLLLYDG